MPEDFDFKNIYGQIKAGGKMVRIGMLGGMLLFLLIVLLVALIFWFLHKEKAGRALAAGVLLLIAIPVWLDMFILFEWYLALPWESSRTPEEWMDFLGSYLGVAGTVVAGALAYWQTKVNRKQDQEIEVQKRKIQSLQDQIAEYQVRPSICFKDGELKVYADSSKITTNQSVYRYLYYGLYGEEPSEPQPFFVCICISFCEKGLIPVEKFVIKEIGWIINGAEYTVILRGRKAEEQDLPVKKLQILIDSKDGIAKLDASSVGWKEFIDAMAKHQGFYTIGAAGFDVSRLRLKIGFVNQFGKPREYEVEYRICVGENDEGLRLQNPHILT